MLNEILEFFRKEKLYAILFLILTVVYTGLFALRSRVEGPKEQESQALKAYEEAEERLQEKVKSAGSIEAYFKDRPDLQFWINFFTLFAMAALLAGFVLDFQLLFNPKWRAWMRLNRAPPHADWKFSLLFKFFIWFFTGTLVLGFALMPFRQVFAGEENFYLLLHTTLAEILGLSLMIGLLRKQGNTVQALGLWIPDGKGFREMMAGWTGYLTLLPVFGGVLAIVLLISKMLHIDPPPHPLVPIFLEEEGRMPLLIYYSLFLAAVFGPIIEEVFFRGFCYPILKQRIGVPFATVTTATFFALIHENSFAFWPIFVLGLGLVYLYEKRGSLVACMTMHITHNVVFLSYFFFTKEILRREIGG